MYFFHYKKSDVFLVHNGIANKHDFLNENQLLVVSSTLSNARKTLVEIQSLFAKKERGNLQIVTQATFKKRIDKSGAVLNKKQILEENSLTVSKLEGLVKRLIQQKFCEVIDSSKFCEPGAKIKEVIKLAVVDSEKEVAAVEISPANTTRDRELIVCKDDMNTDTALTVIKNESGNLLDDQTPKIIEVLLSITELLKWSEENIKENGKKIKEVENQITDELHFIEFEASEQVNSEKVYEKLRELRRLRRKLKDELYVSQLVQETLGNVEEKNLLSDVEKIHNLSDRVYALRAMGKHPERGC